MAINYGSNDVITTGKLQGSLLNGTSKTLYFYGDGDWSTVGNWWLDSSHTIAADRLPNETDNVVLHSSVSGNAGDSAQCANLSIINGNNIYITVSVSSTINRKCLLYNASGTIYLSDTSGLFEGMRVDGVGVPTNSIISAITENTSINISNNATIGGSSNLTFSGQAYFTSNNSGATINGDAYFYNCYNNYTINGRAFFDNSGSYNGGTINGDAIFSNSSNNYGTINGDVIFYSDSYNASNGTIVGNVIFAGNDSDSGDQPNNYGVITGDVIFKGYSYSYGNITGNVKFYDHSNTTGATIYGDVILADNSAIYGGYIYGDVSLTDSSTLGAGGSSGNEIVKGKISFNNSSTVSLNSGSIYVLGDIEFNDASSFTNQGISIYCHNAIWNSTGNSGQAFYGGYIYGNAILWSGYLSNYVYGDATFYNSSYLSNGGSGSSSPIIYNNAIFNNSSYISSSVSSTYIGKSVTFNQSSVPYSGGGIYCPKTFINGSYYSSTYYGDVDVLRDLAIGSNGGMTVYGNITMHGDSYVTSSTLYIYSGKLTLKDYSYIFNGSSIYFYGKSELIIDSNNNTARSSISIYDNSNALTIIVNKLVTNYGWMLGGGSCNIQCDTIIFNNNTIFYNSGNNQYTVNKLIFNNDSSTSNNSGANSKVASTAIFNDSSYLSDNLDVDLAIFNDNSHIVNGAINGTYGDHNAIFNHKSYNSNSGYVYGDATFNDYSYNSGTVYGTIYSDAPYTITPGSALSTDQDNYDPGKFDVLRFQASASGVDITGLYFDTSSGVKEKYIRVLTNVGNTYNITLKHDDGSSSTAANRFLTSTGGDHIIAPSGSAVIIRDTVDNRWRVL